MPGAMFSTVTSAFFSISLTISSPFGDFRLIASDFLLTLNWWKYHGSSSGLPGRSRRPGSPRPGFSILTTSAPNQASTSVEVVPASNWVKSTTLTPCRKLKSWVLSLIAAPPVAAQMPAHSLRLPAPHRNAFGDAGPSAFRCDRERAAAQLNCFDIGSGSHFEQACPEKDTTVKFSLSILLLGAAERGVTKPQPDLSW